MRNGWDVSKTFKGHCFAHISVISHPFRLFLVSFWRVNPPGCGYRCARVQVRVWVELPMGYLWCALILKCRLKEYVEFFWTGHNPNHQQSMDHLPLVAGSRSPSDATHDVETRSTKVTRNDQHLETWVAVIEISKYDSNKKDTRKIRETAQCAEFTKLLNTLSEECILLLPIFKLCRRRRLWIKVDGPPLDCPQAGLGRPSLILAGPGPGPCYI